jgi:hypothetical protein
MSNKKKPVPALKKQQVIQKKPVEVAQTKEQPVSTPFSRTKSTPVKSIDFAFGKWNYILMVAGLVLIALGYILMIGGGSKDPKVFNPAIFDAQRLTFAPIFILLGFAVEIVAILKKPKE